MEIGMTTASAKPMPTNAFNRICYARQSVSPKILIKSPPAKLFNHSQIKRRAFLA
jgi:hypothetical protein